MILSASIICFLSAFYHYWLNGYKWFSVGFIVSFIWGIVLGINFVSPFQWYPMSYHGQLYLLIGTLSLCVGLITTKANASYRHWDSRNVKPIDIKNTFFILQGLLVLLMIPMTIKAFILLSHYNYDFYYLRYLYATGNESDSLMSTAERLIYIHYFVGPCSSACILLDLILCVENGFWKKPLVFLTLLTLFQAFYSAGRSTIFYTIVLLFLIYSSNKSVNGNKPLKPIKRNIIIFSLLGILLISGLTYLRNNSTDSIITNLLQTIIVYFCGGVRIFDQIVQNSNLYGLYDSTYGLSFIAGLVSIIVTVSHYLFGVFGISLFPNSFSVYEIVQGYLIGRIKYGVDSEMNAFPTMFYFFFRDFEIISLIIFPVLFGLILTFVEKQHYKKDGLFTDFLYFYLLYAALMSTCWWEPIRVEFWMTVIWGMVLCKVLIKTTIKMKI